MREIYVPTKSVAKVIQTSYKILYVFGNAPCKIQQLLGTLTRFSRGVRASLVLAELLKYISVKRGMILRSNYDVMTLVNEFRYKQYCATYTRTKKQQFQSYTYIREKLTFSNKGKKQQRDLWNIRLCCTELFLIEDTHCLSLKLENNNNNSKKCGGLKVIRGRFQELLTIILNDVAKISQFFETNKTKKSQKYDF